MAKPKKTSFLIYFNWIEDYFLVMSDQNAGKLIKALGQHAVDETYRPDWADKKTVLAVAYNCISHRLDKDRDSYYKRCRENATKEVAKIEACENDVYEFYNRNDVEIITVYDDIDDIYCLPNNDEKEDEKEGDDIF